MLSSGGRGWTPKKVTISPSRGELTIGTSGLIVKERGQGGTPTLSISQQMSSVFGALVRRTQKSRDPSATQPAQIFAASLKDIEKALAPKKHTDPREKLPKHYHEFLPSSTGTPPTNYHPPGQA